MDWSVWIEGGDRPGRWMSDMENGKAVWRGNREQAGRAATERQAVCSRNEYQVREAPIDNEEQPMMDAEQPLPKSPSLNTQLADAVAAVAAVARAQDHLHQRMQQTASAQREETEAIKSVNEAQQHFDRLVAEVKKSAPRDTLWRRGPFNPE